MAQKSIEITNANMYLHGRTLCAKSHAEDMDDLKED
jgi:hypothetical protein